MVGPYIKSRVTVGTKMSENADLITLETYVQQYMGQNMNTNVHFYYLGGPGIILDLSCFPGILCPIATNKEAS